MSEDDSKRKDPDEGKKAYEKPEIREVDVEVQSLGAVPSPTSGC
jgi:hypothetical protein